MAGDLGLVLDDATIDRFVAAESRFQAEVNTTDSETDARRLRSATDLREILTLTLDEVRGGERFDVQWARARADLEAHGGVVEALEERAARAEADAAAAVARAEAAEALADRTWRRTPRGMARTVVDRLGRTGR